MPEKDKGYIKAFDFLINAVYVTIFAEKKKETSVLQLCKE